MMASGSLPELPRDSGISFPASPSLRGGKRGCSGGDAKEEVRCLFIIADKNNAVGGSPAQGHSPHVVNGGLAVGGSLNFWVNLVGKRLFKPLGIAPKQLNTFANSQRICLLDAYFLASTASISTVASTVATTVNTRRKP
jgi:hypothetical protein